MYNSATYQIRPHNSVQKMIKSIIFHTSSPPVSTSYLSVESSGIAGLNNGLWLFPKKWLLQKKMTKL